MRAAVTADADVPTPPAILVTRSKPNSESVMFGEFGLRTSVQSRSTRPSAVMSTADRPFIRDETIIENVNYRDLVYKSSFSLFKPQLERFHNKNC